MATPILLILYGFFGTLWSGRLKKSCDRTDIDSQIFLTIWSLDPRLARGLYDMVSGETDADFWMSPLIDWLG